jgi:hypothetical protein
MDFSTNRLSPERMAVPARYQPLYDYLRTRFADTVVLTFSQIEDLMGGPLPADARLTSTWWDAPEAGQAPSEASGAWRRADRTAVANMAANTVMFDRGSS